VERKDTMTKLRGMRIDMVVVIAPEDPAEQTQTLDKA
jgi:hypothetical protein